MSSASHDRSYKNIKKLSSLKACQNYRNYRQSDKFRPLPESGLVVVAWEQVEDLLVVELDERDSDEGLNGVPDPQVVEDIVESSRDDAEFAVLKIPDKKNIESWLGK